MEGYQLLTQSKIVIDALERFNVITSSTKIVFEIYSGGDSISLKIYGKFDEACANRIKFGFEDHFGVGHIDFYNHKEGSFGPNDDDPHVNIIVNYN